MTVTDLADLFRTSISTEQSAFAKSSNVIWRTADTDVTGFLGNRGGYRDATVLLGAAGQLRGVAVVAMS